MTNASSLKSHTDVLVIGSGIAGLSFALNLSNLRPDLEITIISKEIDFDGSTRYAQGGMAVVTDFIKDSFENHIQDTINAGRGHCTPEVVDFIIRKAPERLNTLIELGAQFDKDRLGNLDLALEGGHSHPRIIHNGDKTGLEMEEVLLHHVKQKTNITLIYHLLAVDLITDFYERENHCKGVSVFDPGKNYSQDIYASAVLLCTGGCGQVFKITSNPVVASGDGVAMAYRAGAVIKNMNYIQFHPTVLYSEQKGPHFLISEAIRGAGGKLLDDEGNRFVLQFDPRGELATRDIVSDAIFNTLKKKDIQFVYLDIRHLNARLFGKHFPMIAQHLKKQGINYQKELVPVCPAAHYQCGGINTTLTGQTSIEGLYAIGECAHTGLHGANRLASNSLLEALVIAHEAAISMVTLKKINSEIPDNLPRRIRALEDDFSGVESKLKEYMWVLVGNFEDEETLDSVYRKIMQLFNYTEAWFEPNRYNEQLLRVRNMLWTSLAILRHSIQCSFRKETVKVYK